LTDSLVNKMEAENLPVNDPKLIPQWHFYIHFQRKRWKDSDEAKDKFIEGT
jgi:hypothetical protein